EILLRDAGQLFCPIIDCQLFHRRIPFQRIQRTIPNSVLYLASLRATQEIVIRPACYHQRKMASHTPNSAPTAPVNLLGKSPDELRAFIEGLGEPPYRGAQIYHALYAERRFAFSEMTNLPIALR